MRSKKTIIVGLAALSVAVGLLPVRGEACEFFGRLFGGGGGVEAVPPPEISPGVPVYPEETASYGYTTSYGTTVYYRTPVTTYYYPATPTYHYRGPVTYYYRVPSTTTYYAGPGCASSAEPTPAPAPESPGGPQGPPPTYAPEGPAQSPQEQELRKPTPAEEQSGLGGTPSPADTGAPQAEPSTDQPDSGELPAAPQPMTNEPSEDQGQDSAGGVELISPEQRITALPATPRTLDSRYSTQRLTNSQPNRGVARTPMPRWIPVANPPSVASR